MLLLLLTLPVVLAWVFEDEIVQQIKDVANENVNATIDFGAYDLSVFHDFPNFSITVEEVSVTGTDTFAGTHLAKIGKLEITIDILSIWSDKYKIRKIGFTRPEIHVKVLPDGTANYNIALADTTATNEPVPEKTEASGGFHLALSDYFIHEGLIIYEDAAGDMHTRISGLHHEGKGDFRSELFLLETQTHITGFLFDFGGIPYLNHAKVNLDADIDIDLNRMKFTFKENELKINEVKLGMNGWLALTENDVDMDLSFGSGGSTLKDLLSLIPAIYSNAFSDLTANGKIAFEGMAKGKYNESTMPAFDLQLNVDRGSFAYKGLEQSAEAIYIDAQVSREEGGDLDNIVTDVRRFAMKMAGHPIDARLKLTRPITDPNLDCSVRSKIDLASLQKMIPMEEGESYTGVLTADLDLKGPISALTEERYADFDARGQIILTDVVVTSAGIDYATEVKTASLSFSPETVELSRFQANFGKSDVTLNGRLDNLLPYLLQDEVLRGTLTLRSQNLDLREWMTEDETVADTGNGKPDPDAETNAESNTQPATEETLEAIEVPHTLHLKMNVGLARVVYPWETDKNLVINQVKGNITLKDGVARLDGTDAQMLGGSIHVQGEYNTRNPKAPQTRFAYRIKNWDIRQTATTFNTLEKITPLLKSCTGNFSTKLDLACTFNQQFEPDLNSLNGDGDATSDNVFIENAEVFHKLAQQLKTDRLSQQNLKDVNLRYHFKNGRVTVDPFDVKMNQYTANIQGYSTFEQDLDYEITMDIPRTEFGGAANEALNNLVSAAADNGMAAPVGEQIKINASVTGKMNDPKIRIRLGEAGKDPVDALKDQIRDQISTKVDSVKQEVKAKVDEAINKAKEEAAAIMAKAQKSADEIRSNAKKAAETIRQQGNTRANALEKETEGKNIIAQKAAKKAAEKIRKESEEKAKKLMAESDKKATAVLAKAQKAADAKWSE